MGDLIIRGGTVVDGTRRDRYKADVRIRDAVIAEIGSDLSASRDDRIIDARGAFVTPGFIDSHTHFDPSLFWDPACDPMPQHGVTTVLSGNCSLSMAPLRQDHRGQLSRMFSYIEDMPLELFNSEVPWSWQSYAEYLDVVAKAGYGVNVGLLVGHTPLRLWVMGDEAWERTATPEERRRIADELEACLLAGAFGVSLSFYDQDQEGRPVPSTFADDDELLELFGVLAEHNALVEFVPDVRLADYSPQIERIGALCAQTGVTATWNALYCYDERPKLVPTMLDRALEMQRKGIRIYPQVSPRRLDNRVNWHGGMSFSTMPDTWHRFVQMEGPGKRSLLDDEEWRAAARADWDNMEPHNKLRDLSHYRFIAVAKPELDGWINRTLADLVGERGGHPSDVLADWLVENDLKAGVVRSGIANGNLDLVAASIAHPASIVSNSDAGAHIKMMSAAGDTTMLLSTFVRDRADFSLEDAVWQITGRQAEIFGFAGRGRLAVGMAADVTVFALDELTYELDVFVADLPGAGERLRRPSGGYWYTIVGGVVTQERGALSGVLPGRLLRRADLHGGAEIAGAAATA